MDQRTPIQRLSEELNSGQPEELYRLAQQCDQTPAIQLTSAILLIKMNKQQEALGLLRQIKEQPELIHFAKLYAYYKDGQFNQVINECKKQSPEELLVLAQAYHKLGSFKETIKIYSDLLKDNRLQEDFPDIMANLINSAIQTEDLEFMKQINQQTLEFVKKIKNQYTRELLLNHALLNLSLRDFKTTKELIIKFENIVKLDNEQDEDLVLSQIVLDLLDKANFSAKIKYYETFEKSQEQAVILNNLTVFQEKAQQHHHDSLKRIEEAINSDYKFTKSQLHTLKLNRAILQIVRNRPTKEHDLPKILQIATNRLRWEQPIEDLQEFYIFATNNDNSRKILELMKIDGWAKNSVLATFLLAHLLKVEEGPFAHLLEELAKWNKPLLCNYYIRKGNLAKAMEFASKEQTDQLAMLCLQQGQLAQAAKFIDSLEYQPITDMNEIENLERNINLSKKIEVAEKKIQKKRKKRVRFPKNFDKLNPGPPPNPERWLPKYERKEWKKKKQVKSRTQGAGQAGKETSNYFQATGATTANLNVTTKKQKSKHKR